MSGLELVPSNRLVELAARNIVPASQHRAAAAHAPRRYMGAMAMDESNLTLSQAESLASSCLAEHWPEAAFRLAERKTITSGCGWVFTVDIPGPGTRVRPEGNGRLLPTLVFVVKTSAQVVATSSPYSPSQFAKVCERLLARSRANGRAWCLTMGAHLGDGLRPANIAEDARRAGLEQLKAGTMPVCLTR
jgi:hypothetical protein